jgi:hypothetical protein
MISSKMANNRLSKFKKGMIEYGSDVEEAFVSMASAASFDVSNAESKVFQRNHPDVRTAFHRVNRQDMYKTTIEEGQIKRAFTSNDGLGKLVSAIVNSLYSGDNYDEYTLMKESIALYYENFNHAKVINSAQVADQATAKTFFRAVKQASTDFTFVSSNFNPSGVLTFCEKKDQVLLLHKNVNTFLDTELLAWVFNKENISFDTDIVIVDNFGDLANTQAVLCDKRFFMTFDKLFETRNLYNPEGLYYNYWLHHHQTLSTSPFVNAVAFQIG